MVVPKSGKKMAQVLGLVLLALLALTQAGTILNVTSLQEVPDSGDSYPMFLPVVTKANAFAGKRVLFAVAHGVEDHEVYYAHQYFTTRGAIVVFGCIDDWKAVVLSDFIKPTYTVQCSFQLSKSFDLSSFDAIYVPGGVPSSTAIRTDKNFVVALKKFVGDAANKDKLLAIICSGNEILIELDLLDKLPTVIGSPASYSPLEAGLQAVFQPASNYKGLDSNYHAIPYPSDGSRPHIVLGKNPDASQYFVAAIGNTWMNLGESVPPANGGDPLHMQNGRYQHPQFHILQSNGEIPPIPAIWPGEGCLRPANVAAAIGPGATALDLVSLNVQFDSVTFVCPSWIPKYKSGKVYLATDPPGRITHVAQCDTSFDDILSGDAVFDALLIPDGLFSTGGVLRNDRQMMLTAYQFMEEDKPVLFFGTGAQVLIPSRLGMGTKLPSYPETFRDLQNAGYQVEDSNTANTHWAQIVDKVFVFDSVKAFGSTCGSPVPFRARSTSVFHEGFP